MTTTASNIPETASNIPDFSCEIHKPLVYVDFIRDYLHTLQKHQKDNEHMGVRLSPNDVETFCWMLSEAGTVVHQINDAFYSRQKEDEDE
jgi:hypothetical protein